MLRFLTAGESHGQALVTIVDGMPAGLTIDFDAVTAQLRRRQGGYGRGRRMAIESDRANALSGIRHGVTTGAPIALLIPNKDWVNWQKTMYVEPEQPAVNLETLEAFPYSLGRLARVLRYDAGLSPIQSGDLTRREEATEYLLVGVKPDKHKS